VADDKCNDVVLAVDETTPNFPLLRTELTADVCGRTCSNSAATLLLLRIRGDRGIERIVVVVVVVVVVVDVSVVLVETLSCGAVDANRLVVVVVVTALSSSSSESLDPK